MSHWIELGDSFSFFLITILTRLLLQFYWNHNFTESFFLSILYTFHIYTMGGHDDPMAVRKNVFVEGEENSLTQIQLCPIVNAVTKITTPHSTDTYHWDDFLLLLSSFCLLFC